MHTRKDDLRALRPKFAALLSSEVNRFLHAEFLGYLVNTENLAFASGVSEALFRLRTRVGVKVLSESLADKGSNEDELALLYSTIRASSSSLRVICVTLVIMFGTLCSSLP